MKTQLSVRVKKESLFSKSFGRPYLGPLAFFKKTSIIISIDGVQQELTQQKEPYLIDVTPGIHTLEFIDPQLKWKEFEVKSGKVIYGILGFILGVGMGGGTVGGMALSDSFAQTTEYFFAGENGLLQVNIQEGDTIRLKCKAKMNGTVRVDLD